jgi:signal transduction histidine kinase
MKFVKWSNWFHGLVSEIKYGKHHLEYMSTVNESATILMHINDILDFSKIEAGKLALEITNTDII